MVVRVRTQTSSGAAVWLNGIHGTTIVRENVPAGCVVHVQRTRTSTTARRNQGKTTEFNLCCTRSTTTYMWIANRRSSDNIQLYLELTYAS